MQEEKINILMNIIDKVNDLGKKAFLGFLSKYSGNCYNLSFGLVFGFNLSNAIRTELYSINENKFNEIALYLVNTYGLSFSSIFNIDKIEIMDHEYNIVMRSKVLLDDKTLEEEIDVYQKKIDALKLHKANRENSNGDKYF